jgi:hypothetical protein
MMIKNSEYAVSMEIGKESGIFPTFSGLGA